MFADLYNFCLGRPKEIANVTVEGIRIRHHLLRVRCYTSLLTMDVRWTLDAIFHERNYSDGGICQPPYPNVSVRCNYSNQTEEAGHLCLKRARGSMKLFERDWPLFRLYSDEWKNPDSVNRYFVINQP